MKILLAVDGSAFTQRMLDYLAAHEELLGKNHDFVAFTATIPVPKHAARFIGSADIQRYHAEEAAEVLKPVSDFAAKQGWRLETLHAAGHAADGIAQAARDVGAGLIVMGTHGHSELGNLVMGSVATGVLARSSVPVLLVR